MFSITALVTEFFSECTFYYIMFYVGRLIVDLPVLLFSWLDWLVSCPHQPLKGLEVRVSLSALVLSQEMCFLPPVITKLWCFLPNFCHVMVTSCGGNKNVSDVIFSRFHHCGLKNVLSCECGKSKTLKYFRSIAIWYIYFC